MTHVFVWGVILICCGWTTRAQRDYTLKNANESIAAAAPTYQVIADRNWGGQDGVLDFFEELTDERAALGIALADLFTNITEGTMVNNMVIDPVCGYAPTLTTQYDNQTNAQDYLCCHLHVLNFPGVIDFVSRLELYFMGTSTATGVLLHVTEQTQNIADLREIETQAINVMVCKDDLRIDTPETLILRSEIISKIVGTYSRVYAFLTARAKSLSTCIGMPLASTGCIANVSPLLDNDVAAVNSLFTYVDEAVIDVCGWPALAAFENFRASKTTCL